MTGKGSLIVRPETLPRTLEESLTHNFYRWERRGRGWRVWDRPVDLEPPFEPFFFHALPLPRPSLDDARKPTALSRFAEALFGRKSLPPPEPDWSVPIWENEIIEPEPEVFADLTPLVEIQLALPSDQKVTPEGSEPFLLSLSHASRPLAFEVVGLPEAIHIQFACREPDAPLLCQQLEAHFPQASLHPQNGFVESLWADHAHSLIVDFGLSEEFMRPLRTAKSFEPDPLIGLVGALSDLDAGEVGMLQILFQPVHFPWAASILRSVTDGAGGPFFADAPEMVGLAREKVERPLYACVLRAAARSPRPERPAEIARALFGGLSILAQPGANEPIPLTNENYDDSDHAADLLARRTRRSGMLLNSRELLTLAHPPSSSVRTAKLRREMSRTKTAPAVTRGHALVLGENVHRGSRTIVTLSPAHRLRHMHVVGATGTGKSTLLLHLLTQDIEQGMGVALIDPHGDLADRVLERIPERRRDDVVLLDPSDMEYPVGFNILQAHSELEKTLLSSDLVSVFRRLSTSWGDQMTSILGNAVVAFLESGRGGTLADLRRFLVDAEFRRAFLPSVRDPEVVYFWQKEYPLLSGKPQAPLLTRLDTFLRPRPIRNMVSQKENRLDFSAILNEGKILLAKLAQGAVGEENAYLLGSLLVSKFHQLAIARQALPESERRPFYLYIDEFQHFITPTMAAILSGGRKFGLGLTLSHQDLSQLSGRDAELTSAVLSNPAVRVCFRLGDQDAKRLAEGFSSFSPADFLNLGVGQAICRVERSDFDFNLSVPMPSALDPQVAGERRAGLIARSREKYAIPRAEAERALGEARSDAWIAPPVPETPEAERRPLPGAALPKTLSPRPRQAPLPPVAPPPPVPPGRGGREHKRLQNLIKRMGEAHGFKATVEKAVLDGAGSVDVALEREGQSIACEISVTTSPDQETRNIRKCLAAGFSEVILVASERKPLEKTEARAAASLDDEERGHIHFLTPHELLAFLESRAAEAAGGSGTVRGYKFKVSYRVVPEAEQEERRRVIAKTMIQSMRKSSERVG